jgi:phosphatidylserine/phosphatidylglycerophosphate/cardiolipin synthase-like enzyme
MSPKGRTGGKSAGCEESLSQRWWKGAGPQIGCGPASLKHDLPLSLMPMPLLFGTANFDNRSFRLNFEITMAFADEELSSQVRQMLEQDGAHSKLLKVRELKDRVFWFRLGVRVARLMAPIQ